MPPVRVRPELSYVPGPRCGVVRSSGTNDAAACAREERPNPSAPWARSAESSQHDANHRTDAGPRQRLVFRHNSYFPTPYRHDFRFCAMPAASHGRTLRRGTPRTALEGRPGTSLTQVLHGGEAFPSPPPKPAEAAAATPSPPKVRVTERTRPFSQPRPAHTAAPAPCPGRLT